MNIDRFSLQVIKSYVKPTKLTVMVLSSICCLFGYEESWPSAKKELLIDSNIFLQRL
jgi:hypothetical protein